MKVFIDTEFYEHGSRNYGLNTVELISLGAVREDGATFYAESARFNWDNVPLGHWLWENVKPHLWHGNEKPLWLTTADVKDIPQGGLYTPAQMAQKFWEFSCTYALHPSGVTTRENVRPEFWGYFCDYDWVAICGLYGRMIDLPPEFPKYCLDLKQEMHRLGVHRPDLPAQDDQAHHALADARWIRTAYDAMPGDGFSLMDELL